MGLIFAAAALLMYAAPVAIAVARRHRSAAAIGATNLLLGWTALGWVVALVWALTGNTRQRREDGSWR